VSALLLAVIPLVGVALGASLTTLNGRRAEIKALFREAAAAVAYAHAAHSIYTRDDRDGPVPGEHSARLEGRMREERTSALILARAALSRLVPFDDEFASVARDINRIREDAVLTEVLTMIERIRRRALRPSLRHPRP
jgi:hypothetical protein